MNATIEAPERIFTDAVVFPAGTGCPLCGDDMDVHTWVDVVAVVTYNGAGPERGSGSVVGCDRVVCRWFVMCTNTATHTVADPLLGYVPACDRCPEIGR